MNEEKEKSDSYRNREEGVIEKRIMVEVRGDCNHEKKNTDGKD